jgi:hypothetical protein
VGPQVAQHDAPIKVVKWVDTPQAGILATGSWDKTIKVLLYSLYWSPAHFIQYWDLRTPAPVATVQLPERCYSPTLSVLISLSDKIQASTFNTHSWSSGPPSVTSRYSI